MAGYLAHQVRTWAEAKQLYEIETEGLPIFACSAGVMNARDPFEMGRMQHELQQCLPPLQLTEQMRQFSNAPTPPPAVPIPFPPGLFSPLATPPLHQAFGVGGRAPGVGGEEADGQDRDRPIITPNRDTGKKLVSLKR